MAFKDFPFALYRKFHYYVRREFFSVNKPDIDVVLPYTTVNSLEKCLKRNNAETRKPFSYYKGADMNLAIPMRRDDEWVDYQLHIRGYRETNDLGQEYTSISVHYELNPIPDGQTRPHLEETNMNIEDPIPMLVKILDENGINHQVKNI